MSIALYRRYRPESFAEVIGQDHVTQPLMASLDAGRVSHAYLFSGPRGCGKTTSARIFARCLNCEQGPTSQPCGTCASCVELAREGSGSLDVVEIDAASHNGVDDARDLRERAAFAPARDRYKIFILDEAHMVTPQGFNALLKLVEEPPAHVKFIFATTEPEKVIGTIRSRTHHYPFRLVPPEQLTAYLQELSSAEEVEIASGVLPLVVRAGGGSVRDSLSVLDQLMAGAIDGKITYERAAQLLGFTSSGLLDDAVGALAGIDGAALFRVVDHVVESGHDPHRFTQDFLQRLRDLVVLAIAGQDGRDAIHGVPVDELDAMVDQAKQLGARRASASADAVHDALAEMTGATSPRLQLELLCARLILIQETADQPRPPAQAPAATTAQVAQGSASKRPPLPTFGKAKEDPPTRKDPSPTARPEADPTSAPISPTGTPRVPLPGQRPDTGMAPAESAAEAPPTSTSSMPPAERHGDVEDTENERTSAPAVAASSQDVGAGDDVRAGDESTAMSDPKEHREPSSADADMLRRRWNEVLGVLENLSRVTWTQVRDTASVGPLRDQELLILFRHRGVLMRFNQGNNQQILAHAIYQALGLQLRVRGVDAAQYDATGGERDPKAEGEAQRQNSSQHHETNPSARAASADEHTGGQREEEVHKARPTADGIPADGEVVTNEDASAAPPTVPIPQVPLPGASETPVPPTPRFGDRQYNLAEDHHSLAHPPAVESVRTEPSEEQEREGPPDDSGGASSDDEVVENVPQQVDGVKLLQQHLGGIVIEEIDEP